MGVEPTNIWIEHHKLRIEWWNPEEVGIKTSRNRRHNSKQEGGENHGALGMKYRVQSSEIIQGATGLFPKAIGMQLGGHFLSWVCPTTGNGMILDQRFRTDPSIHMAVHS